MRRRVVDKRVLVLVKAFLKAGILTEGGTRRDTVTGTPQGGILSPLLSNVALSALDEHAAEVWARDSATFTARQRRRRHGLGNWRLVRYADDFVLLVSGTKAHVETLREEVAAVLAQVGLRLSEQKTRVAHIDEGFDFLGWRIQRQQKRGAVKRVVYTYPTKAALAAVKAMVRTLTRGMTNHPLNVLLHQLNSVLRGWTSYFRHGVSKATFSYLRAFVWRRVVNWLRRKHPRSNWKQLRRRYLPGWWPTDGEVVLLNPAAVTVTRYRYRAARIPSPWDKRARGAVA
jgi:RNA-directed DNA polymerase